LIRFCYFCSFMSTTAVYTPSMNIVSVLRALTAQAQPTAARHGWKVKGLYCNVILLER
jgi:hypothetical protein